MQDIDGGLHPAVDGQKLGEGEGDAATAAAEVQAISLESAHKRGCG